ncbi:MAG TPA: type II secretion system protein GspG [Rhodothermia bacterium]|nr:type II secretion system protein GspG [Rhodothermia bacterium]
MRKPVGLTLLAAIVIFSFLPSGSPRRAEIARRIDSEIETLKSLAVEYLAEQGSYPDSATWRRWADRADSRFYDPWGRLYHYESADDGSLTISSLGRDGTAGGQEEDADVWVLLPPAAEHARNAS